MAKSTRQKTVLIILILLGVIAFSCYCTYKPGSYKNNIKVLDPNIDRVVRSDDDYIQLVQEYETKPREMELEHLQYETDLIGFGMGPGLVDSRRHHVIA